MRLLAPFILLTAAAITASQESQPQKPRTDATPTTPELASTPEARKTDGVLAGWVMLGSNNEVALAQIAQQRAQDPEVKRFAQMMVDDHRQFSQRLQPFAAPAGFGGSTPGGMVGRESGAGEGRPREASATIEGALDHVALIQDLERQCLESARRELESKSGAEFDRCFMGMMIGGHMKANDQLVVFQRYASSPLENVFSEGQRKVSMHLDQAKEIGKRIEGSSMKSEERPK
jgi:predicted outer membrane protein